MNEFMLGIKSIERNGITVFETQWQNTGVSQEAVLSIVSAFLKKARRDYQYYFESKI